MADVIVPVFVPVFVPVVVAVVVATVCVDEGGRECVVVRVRYDGDGVYGSVVVSSDAVQTAAVAAVPSVLLAARTLESALGPAAAAVSASQSPGAAGARRPSVT